MRHYHIKQWRMFSTTIIRGVRRLGMHFGPSSALLAWALTGIMCLSFLFTDAVLSLRALSFYDAVPGTALESWLQLPTRLLFPGHAIIWPIHFPHAIPAPLPEAWVATWLLLLCFMLLFGGYVLAIRVLAARTSLRHILFSTLLFGVLCLFFQATTSQDIFSYIAYARMAALYHLNPLITVPTAIAHDQVYPYLYWIDQPSAYGPTWILLTGALQWGAAFLGASHLLPMILLLRGVGLIAHLLATLLVWQLAGGFNYAGGEIQHRRLGATLAFAWNPLLLFEACINAHNDTVIILLVLLAIWCLQKYTQGRSFWAIFAIAILALAACLKINLIILLPGAILFLYKWQPRSRYLWVVGIATYVLVIVLLYAPFWANGAVFQLLRVNPSTSRDINSPYEFFAHLCYSLIGRPFPRTLDNVGTPVEIWTHVISLIGFAITYGILFIQSIIIPHRISSLLSLVKWMTVVWFLYCLVGSPWLWPWYLVTFFGLFALIEATDVDSLRLSATIRLPEAVRLFAFALLVLYFFASWAPHATFVPFMAIFQWMFMRGLWLCLLPLLALRRSAPFWQQWKFKGAPFSKTQQKNS